MQSGRIPRVILNDSIVFSGARPQDPLWAITENPEMEERDPAAFKIPGRSIMKKIYPGRGALSNRIQTRMSYSMDLNPIKQHQMLPDDARTVRSFQQI
jgi:hypothetical protein